MTLEESITELQSAAMGEEIRTGLIECISTANEVLALSVDAVIDENSTNCLSNKEISQVLKTKFNKDEAGRLATSGEVTNTTYEITDGYENIMTLASEIEYRDTSLPTSNAAYVALSKKMEGTGFEIIDTIEKESSKAVTSGAFYDAVNRKLPKMSTYTVTSIESGRNAYYYFTAAQLYEFTEQKKANHIIADTDGKEGDVVVSDGVTQHWKPSAPKSDIATKTAANIVCGGNTYDLSDDSVISLTGLTVDSSLNENSKNCIPNSLAASIINSVDEKFGGMQIEVTTEDVHSTSSDPNTLYIVYDKMYIGPTRITKAYVGETSIGKLYIGSQPITFNEVE